LFIKYYADFSLVIGDFFNRPVEGGFGLFVQFMVAGSAGRMLLVQIMPRYTF
jgi:hypothetical protein